MVKTEVESLEQISIRNLKDQGYFQGGMVPLLEDINFTTSNCNLGGQRIWFLCKCRARVGVLYAVNDGFGCKNCLNLTYRSRNEKKSLRNDPIFRALNDMIKVNELKDKIKRAEYGGEATNNQQRLNLLYAKLVLTNHSLLDPIKHI